GSGWRWSTEDESPLPARPNLRFRAIDSPTASASKLRIRCEVVPPEPGVLPVAVVAPGRIQVRPVHHHPGQLVAGVGLALAAAETAGLLLGAVVVHANGAAKAQPAAR